MMSSRSRVTATGSYPPVPSSVMQGSLIWALSLTADLCSTLGLTFFVKRLVDMVLLLFAQCPAHLCSPRAFLIHGEVVHCGIVFSFILGLYGWCSLKLN